MYAIINNQKLYLVQLNLNDYFFTNDKNSATVFFTEKGAKDKIKKLPIFKNLKIKKI